MMNRLLNRKWRIKSRIFIILLVFMAVVFLSVFISFNLFIKSYTLSYVENQLDDLTHSSGMNDNPPDKPPGDNFTLPDITGQKSNRLGVKGAVFIVDISYGIKEYDRKEDIDELRQIAEYLKNKNLGPENARNIFVSTSQNEFYISSKENPSHPNTFLIYYVSVTGLNNLMDTVNMALAVIVTLAMIICFFIAKGIANSVTMPVNALSGFACEIGKGNFERNDFSFRDIEFENLGESMNQSAEKLALYDKEQKVFFQNVSHELRTPLMSIRCYAEGVQYGLMEPKKSCETIIAETDRLTELVEDLLYISRVDNITNALEKSENDLRDTLSLCAEGIKPVADKKGIAIEYRFSDEPVIFSYNEKHMYRAFSNLISNALRYAKKTIVLSCEKSGGQIQISVFDDGEGVNPEDMPYIFERFYSGRGGKHGIGLSIVKSVAELHGGEVMADMEKGGSFRMVFKS